MKLTGPACTEALSGAEEARRRERAEDGAGGVRVELRVRPKRAGEYFSIILFAPAPFDWKVWISISFKQYPEII